MTFRPAPWPRRLRSQEWFEGFTPFLYTYLTKFASEQSSLLEHRDWMYVDELPGERSGFRLTGHSLSNADTPTAA